MVTRNELLSRAIDECLKELYSFVQPNVTWEEFIVQNKVYTNLYKEWENYRKSEDEGLLKEYDEKLDWKNKSRKECIGPAPYEFYYLPKEILKDIVDNYIYVYKMDEQQNLLDIIDILKNYCRKPIVDKYIEGENGFPGYRGYDHPDDLVTEITKILADNHEALNIGEAEKLRDKFFEFLDMAGNFFNWNRELSSFNTSIYLGPSPNSNKQAVIENWKKYKGVDIEINEEKMIKDYYGEED